MGVSFRAGRAPAGVALGEQLEKIGEARNDVGGAIAGSLRAGRYPLLSRGVRCRPRTSWNGVPALLIQRIAPSRGLSFDPYAAMLVYLALTLACLGYVDQARSRMDEALAEARRLGHVHTLVLRFVFLELDRLAHRLAEGAQRRNFWR